MIDFTLDSVHQELQDMYRKFAEERVKPLAHEMDEKEVYDRGLLKEMQDCGFFGIPFSEEYAGEVDIYKVDIDREQELAAAFGVRSVPTLLFIPARGMPQMATGALPKETLREAIGELLLKLPAAES